MCMTKLPINQIASPFFQLCTFHSIWMIISCRLKPPFFFFFNDTATTEIYTLSLHDALPISCQVSSGSASASLCLATPTLRNLGIAGPPTTTAPELDDAGHDARWRQAAVGTERSVGRRIRRDGPRQRNVHGEAERRHRQRAHLHVEHQAVDRRGGVLHHQDLRSGAGRGGVLQSQRGAVH